ncbi:MAG: ABC transporter ATP-binding protein [Chloroflexota bacterium]
MPTTTSAWRVLATYLRPQRTRVLVLALLLLATIGLELANPQILRVFIDSAAQDADIDRLLAIGVVFLVVALATQLVSVAETFFAENVGLTATNALRADLTLHVLRLDPDFLAGHTPGELIERVDGDVGTLANFFARFVVYVMGNGLLVVGLVLLLVQIDWRVGVAMGGSVLLAILAMNRLRAVAVPYWAAARQASADLFGFLEERLAGTEDIRAMGATAYVMRRFHERSRRLLRRELQAGVVGNLGFQSAATLLTLGGALAIGLGGYLFLTGAITLGSVYVIFAYTQVLNRPIEQITRQMQDLQQAGAGLRRIQRLLALRSSLADGERQLPSGALSVEVERVCFGYVPEEPVLRDVSFRLEAGEVLGVLGRTGIGKTTLAKLLLRLHDPREGRIQLDGCDLRGLRMASLRQRVGLVTQDIQLFHASVRENLALFDARVSDARMLEVLAELELGDWLQRLPSGLDTLLAPGGSGSGMSAGEAQILAFARVFLRDPGLVILDEASSRLDPATERRMEHAVDRLLQGRTGIIIAHRLTTIQRVDKVLILDENGVREWGPREVLSNDPTSTFSGLLRTGAQELLA